MNTEKFLNTLRASIYKTPTLICPEEIDAVVDNLVKVVSNTVKAATPISRVSPKSMLGFNDDCREAVKNVRRLNYRY